MLNDYCESAFYKANFSYGEYTARRGTQEARRFWFRWGNPCDRYARRAMKGDRSEKKKDSRGLIRNRLKSVNIDTTEEEIDNILTECFDSEVCRIKWCYFQRKQTLSNSWDSLGRVKT